MFIDSSDIPYLKQCPQDGRIRPLLTFYDGSAWHVYQPTEGSRLFEIRPVNLVTGLYLAAAPADPADIEIPLLTFLFQRFPTPRTFAAFDKLQSDLENALAVLHKQPILFEHFARHDADFAYARAVATELEYALFNHRSAYDLLHGVATSFLVHHGLNEQNIPDSFRKVGQKTHAERIAYGFSTALAQFYESRSERFILFRDLRDAIGHGGDTIHTIYRLPEGFGIGADTRIARKLKENGLWDAMRPTETGIGSCFAFAALLCADIFEAVEAFTTAFAASFRELPAPTADGYRIFSRSPLLEHFRKLPDYLARPWRFGPQAGVETTGGRSRRSDPE